MAPLPKPPEQRRRRNHGPQITYLPADGRKGRTPKWPFDDVRAGELNLWREMWKKPEAVLWEREMAHRLVARYVRVLALAEGMSGDQARYAWNECRALEDRLLLSPKAKVAARYAVRVPEEVAPIAGVAPTANGTGMTPAERLAAAS